MTIDEVIKELKFDKASEDTIYNEQFYEQLIEWLEELKTYKEYGVINKESFDKGYDKAIDDFTELCLKHKSKDEYPIMCFDEFTIKKFAEQLKGRG